MRKINHIGIPTQTPQPGESYAEGLKVWLTNFNESPNKIEFLRFEEGSWMPELMPGGENLTIAFIEEEGIALELMYFEK